MFLNAETFSAIIKALRSDGRGESEKRSHPRAGLSTPMEIIPVTPGTKAGKPITVHLRDLSVSGMGLSFTGDFRDGDRFVVSLPRAKRAPMSLLCVIVHVRAVSEHQTLVGAKLVRELNADQLKAVMNGDPTLLVA